MKKNVIKLAAAALSAMMLMSSCAGSTSSPTQAPATQKPATQAPAAQTPATQAPATQAPAPAAPSIPANMNPIGQLPIVKEKVNLSVFTGAPSGVDFDTNMATKTMEDKTNVHINWVQAPDSERETKMNLLLASGDYPEIIMASVGSHAKVYSYAQQGVFIPITNYIDTYAPEMKAMFEQYPTVAEDMVMPDGNVYGFTAIDDCYHCSMNRKLWVYTEWLDVLNIKMPQTIDDFYNMLVAFKTQDPNKNGKNDIIPYAGCELGKNAQNNVDVIINSWIINDGDKRLRLLDGKVDAVYDEPEWREGLRFLNKLVKEGLMSTESFVQDRNGLKQMGENPEYNILGACPTAWGTQVTMNVNEQNGRWSKWKTIPPLEGPNGYRVAVLNPLSGNNRAVITNKCKNVEVAVRWLDNMYTVESALITVQGEENVNWKYSAAGSVGINGLPALWERISQTDPTLTTNKTWSQKNPNFRSEGFRLSEKADRTRLEQETILFDETKNNYEPYKNDIKNIVPSLIFSEQQSAELVDLETSIKTYVQECIAKFSVGDLDIEKDWDAYLKELKNIGIDKYLAIYQAAYDQRVATRAK